ncbi:MAG TPA: amidohydrolase family protein [Woeseiaceae bacterium]|nr:amidohydrolase family protein [Woeseiaceae bacterium]
MSCARGIVRAAALACTFLAGAAFAEPPPRELVIEDVTVVSPERGEPLAHANVLVRDGRIAAVSTRPLEASHTIDGRGRFLVPGLIDSHVHLGEAPGVTPLQAEAHPELVRAARAQEPRSYLYFGFTTVVDLISDPERTARWRAAPDRPDVVSCGAAPIANGYPMAWVPEDLRFRLARYFLYDPRQADRIPDDIDPAEHTPEAVVRRMAADGAVCVKTFHETGFGGLHDLPTPTLEMARALVAAAHERGMPVLMHANSVAAQRFALEAGADVIAHGLWNGFEVDGDGFSNGADGVLEAISAKGIGWQPTMQVLQGLSDLFDETFLDRPAVRHAYPQALIDWYRTPEGRWFHDEIASGLGGADGRAVFASVLERIRAVVPVVARGDATLLFGSDTPSAPTYANPPGLNGRLEMQRWIDAGITEARLFRALTLDNARTFGLDERIGSIEAGKVAHLLLLRANPLEDVSAWDTIETVILAGRPIARETLSATRAPRP